ncbi:ABC transporter permease [Brevundimonas sp.]|uniref:ABC transporter permease n=1 Tax=Brevundimonas sp. TaxID=1871086 RepID=UPI00286CFC57|nr:ABC transporter permease [Brevundimonas sp.]
MNRILLIAQREFLAYAKTVGFWLSLLAFPIFAVLGGAVPLLMRGADPVRAVVLIEEGPAATGLAAAVKNVLDADTQRQAERAREAAEKAARSSGAPPGAAESAIASMTRARVRFIDAPADLSTAAPGPAQDAVVRRYLTDATPKEQRLDAVVFLTRTPEGPAARVWAARATDDTVEDFVRRALRDENRDTVLREAGIDAAVVERVDAFRPEINVFSPRSASGGEVSFKDRLPGIIGLAFSFILWSLIITGASILLNSVMEEKSNKILEVLLSSASATEILAGKVLGVAMLTLSVLVVWGGIGAVGLITAAPSVAGDVAAVLMTNGLIFYFIGYIVGGYLMYAVLFAAIGAFCETPRDAQTLMGPIMMVLVVPLLVVQMALVNPDAPAVKFLSWVPFFTPFLMSARAPSGPPMIEIIGTMAGMFAVALLMVWLAGRAFRAGALSDVKLSWKSFGQAISGGGR